MTHMVTTSELRAMLHQVENLTQLAKRAGVSRKTLYRIKAGDVSPRLATVERIVAAVKVSSPAS